MNTKDSPLKNDWLLPLSDKQPCGENLEYDPEYLMLFTKATEQPETQYGDFINTPESINWNEVEREALRLLLRSKDIRVLTLLLRSRTQLNGAQGLLEGMRLLYQLLTTYPQHIHPQIAGDEDTSEEEAIIIRGNALAALSDPDGILSDIRGITLAGNAALRLQVRDVERALSIPHPADALAPDSVRRQLLDLRMQGNPALLAFDETAALVPPLQEWANELLHESAPDFTPLKKLLAFMQNNEEPLTPPLTHDTARIQQATQQDAQQNTQQDTQQQVATPAPSLPATPFTSSAATASVAPPAAPSAIGNRFDALQRIKAIRAWFELNEPSSPTIPLLRQAEHMVGKRFSEVVDAIPLDLLQKWDKLNE